MSRARDGRRALLLAAAALLAVMALHLAVNLNLTVYSDDYWYGTFFRDGLRGFVRNTIEHYRGTNGRVLVHILIPILLLADTKVFALISPPLTAALFAAGLAAQDRRQKAPALLLGPALSLLTVLGSEIQYLRMSLYWLSAYFNYAFPLLFPLLTLWLLERSDRAESSGLETAALYLCALLSGMGTEQSGVVSLTALWGYWLCAFLGREPRARRALRCALLTSLGYVTILLAPGSHARIGRGIDGGLLSVLRPGVFADRFFDVMRYLCGYGFWNALFVAFCLLTALLCLTDRARPKALLAGFPAAIAVAALAIADMQKPLAVLTVLYTLYAAAWLLTREETRVTALLTLGAGASVMFLTVTTLYYARTFFPCVLLFITVCWSLFFRVCESAGPLLPRIVCAALAALLLARYIPIYRGYAANKTVVDRNLAAVAAAKSGAPLELSIDLDADYRFTVFFEGGYFLANFLRYYDLPDDTPVRFTSEVWDVSDVACGGKTSTFPALERDGTLLLPIEFVFQSLGERCTFDWTDDAFTIEHGGETYRLYERGLAHIAPDGGESAIDESCRYVMPFSYTYTLLYLSAEDFARCFGVTFAYDAASDCYLVR